MTDDFDLADATVPIETVPLETVSPQTVSPPAAPLWQPGTRLSARVTPVGDRTPRQSGRDPRWIAAIILIAALAIAAALWLVALWIRASDDPNEQAPDEAEVTMSILADMSEAEVHDA